MAIYHLNGKIISRGKGHNAVAAAAYRYAGKFFDERCNRTWNFENKKGVVHTEINFPTNSPVWVKEIDSAKLWNMVEKREGEVDSQLARSIVFALPIELTQEQNIILAREFIKDEFAARGMIADWCVHYDDPSNPHVHLMLTMRELKESGFGIKVREWNAKLLLITWRSKWAEYANRHLKLHQHNTHIDHRSLKDQGIDLIPTVHRGRATDEINRRGKYAERKNEFNEIKKENLSRILKNPDLLVKKILQTIKTIEHHESVFSEQELRKEVLIYANSEAEFNSAMENIKKSKDLIYLGVGEDGLERYTSRRMFNLENNIQMMADQIQKRSHVKISHRQIHRSLERYQTKIGKRLTGEQRIAVQHIVSQDSISCIVGRAGTGKSFSLGAANAIWEAKRLKVYGIALMGVAAAGIHKSSGIESRTIESFRFSVEKGIISLDSRDVIVMDEAGMTDSVAMEAVLKAVYQSRAKLVLVGDHAQLQPVGPGATFRAILERVGFEELQTVYRQEVDWQREATRELSRGETRDALERYQRHGFIHFEKYPNEAMRKLVEHWGTNENTKENNKLVLAHRNKDVDTLNQLLRQKRINQNEIIHGYVVSSRNDEKIHISKGDKILFLKNKKKLGVKNGHFAEITDIRFNVLGKISSFSAVLDEDKSKVITVDPAKYHHFTYGYAATVHKSQGTTVDHAFVYLGGRWWNRCLTYVALSRHRYSCNIYGDQHTHHTLESLKNNISRKARKDSILDYPLAFAERRGLGIESLMQRLPQYLSEKFGEKFKKLRNTVAEVMGVPVKEQIERRIQESETLTDLLKKYVNCQIKQARLVHSIGATKFNSPNESQSYLEQYKENKKEINNCIKRVVVRPDVQENFNVMKKTKPLKLSEIGGFEAIAERINKNQFEPLDVQVLVTEIRGELLAAKQIRSQEQARGRKQ